MPLTIPIRSEVSLPVLKLPTLAAGDVYRFHTMVKPSGAQCNLDCTYCFYLHKEDLLAQPKMARMSGVLLESHIRQYIEAQTADQVVFSWQGGEPTLMGLDFFERIVVLQRKYAKRGQKIENDLQTNGVLLDDAWCAFLKRHNFLVGLSIDGPAQLHDVYRVNKGGGSTHDKVMKAIGRLHAHNVPFNALCVVNRTNAKRPIDVYRFLRDDVRPRMIQFIPCVEPVDFHSAPPSGWSSEQLPLLGSPQARPGTTGSVVTDWSVDPGDWGYFLTRVWDEWMRKDYGRVYIDQFENIISMLFGQGAQKCVNSEVCGKALAIEHNGDVYSCDHFVYPTHRLGNIADTHEGDLVFSAQQKAFGHAKSNALPEYCLQCRYLNYCWGECPKNRFIKSPDGQAGLSYLCGGMKVFYAKAVESRGELSRRLGLP